MTDLVSLLQELRPGLCNPGGDWAFEMREKIDAAIQSLRQSEAVADTVPRSRYDAVCKEVTDADLKLKEFRDRARIAFASLDWISKQELRPSLEPTIAHAMRSKASEGVRILMDFRALDPPQSAQFVLVGTVDPPNLSVTWDRDKIDKIPRTFTDPKAPNKPDPIKLYVAP